MTSKEEHLRRFKEERIAREKARIQMLHDLNLKKYCKSDDNWRYFKSNTSLNKSGERSPVKNASYMKRSFGRNVNNRMKTPRVKNHLHVQGFSDNCLNISAPVSGNASFSEDLAPKRTSIHNTAVEHNKSFDYSPTSTNN